MNSQLASINTNSILLATSSSTCVKGTASRNDSHVKAAIETDATSDKKDLYKNFIYNEFTLTYASAYMEKKLERNVKEYSSHILRYMNIYEYMQYIYHMSSTGQV